MKEGENVLSSKINFYSTVKIVSPIATKNIGYSKKLLLRKNYEENTKKIKLKVPNFIDTAEKVTISIESHKTFLEYFYFLFL